MTVKISGGRKLNQYIDDLKRKFDTVPTTLIGVPKAAGEYEDGIHTATVAAVNEFGSADGRIPERSFLRSGIADAEPQVKKLYEKMLPELLDDNIDINQIQSMVGELAVGSVVEKISSVIPPANAPSTIAKKGSSTPLIDTGHLRQSITYVLSDPGEDIQEGL